MNSAINVYNAKSNRSYSASHSTGTSLSLCFCYNMYAGVCSGLQGYRNFFQRVPVKSQCLQREMLNGFQQRGRRSRGEGWLGLKQALVPTSSFWPLLPNGLWEDTSLCSAPCHTGPRSSTVSPENLLSTAQGHSYTLAHGTGPIRPRKWLPKCSVPVSS